MISHVQCHVVKVCARYNASSDLWTHELVTTELAPAWEKTPEVQDLCARSVDLLAITRREDIEAWAAEITSRALDLARAGR